MKKQEKRDITARGRRARLTTTQRAADDNTARGSGARRTTTQRSFLPFVRSFFSNTLPHFLLHLFFFPDPLLFFLVLPLHFSPSIYSPSLMPSSTPPILPFFVVAANKNHLLSSFSSCFFTCFHQMTYLSSFRFSPCHFPSTSLISIPLAIAYIRVHAYF